MSLSAATLLALVCGIAMPFSIRLVGEIYVGELLLIPVGLAMLVLSRGGHVLGHRVFLMLAIGCVVSLLGYMLSDILNETEQQNYLRGWARVAIVLTDFVALSALSRSNSASLWWFCLGYAVAQILELMFIQHAAISTWKVTYADPVTFLACCLAYKLGLRRTAALLIVTAAIGIMLDSRATPVVVTGVAIVLWARRRRPDEPLNMRRTMKRLLFPAVLAVLAVTLALNYTADEYSTRRDVSSVGRAIGLRLGVKSIFDSPFIGVGSWNDNKEATREMQEEMLAKFGNARRGEIGSYGFSPHSQILVSWYEGGLLGAAFFLVYGVFLVKTIPAIALKRRLDALSALYLFVCLIGLWHLFMSPFAGDHRIRIAMTAAVVVAVATENFGRVQRTRLLRP
jgi:hypothetical protein